MLMPDGPTRKEKIIFSAFRQWVESHFNLLLVLGFALGMVLPWTKNIPNIVVFLFLGGMIYFSYARITVDELRHINLKHALLFYVIRFLFLPLVLYGLAAWVVPDYKYAVLLLSLMPVGAAAAPLSSLLGGNVTMALGYLVVSSFLVPFILPSAFVALGYEGVQLDMWALFYTLCGVIFVPVILYFGLTRPFAPLKDIVRDNARFGTVVLVAGLIVVVIGRQREQILSNPIFLLETLPVLIGLFAVFYLFGWLFPYGGQKNNRIAHTVCSGAMNNALAIGIAAAYFSPQMALIMVLTEVPWVMGLPLFKSFLQWRDKKQRGI